MKNQVLRQNDTKKDAKPGKKVAGLGIGVVVVGGLLLYGLTRKSGDDGGDGGNGGSNGKGGIPPEEQNLMDDSQKAAQAAADALAKAQSSEQDAKIAEQVDDLRKTEFDLEQQQIDALTKTAEEAAAKESSLREQEQALAAQRKALEDSKRSSLDQATQAMNDAKAAVAKASSIFEDAMAIVNQKNKLIADVKAYTGTVLWVFKDDGYKGTKSEFPVGNYLTLKDTTVGNGEASSLYLKAFYAVECYEDMNYNQFNPGKRTASFGKDGGLQIPKLGATPLGNDALRSMRVKPWTANLETELNTARITANTVKDDLLATIFKADICAENVLRQTSELQILGLLLDLCNKVDALARGIRDELMKLKAAVEGSSTTTGEGGASTPASGTTPLIAPYDPVAAVVPEGIAFGDGYYGFLGTSFPVVGGW